MKKIFMFSVIFTILFASCNKDEPTTEPGIEVQNEVNDFVWRGLNANYYWQADVSDLADSKKENKDEYSSFLNSHSKPEDFFYSLLYKYKGNVGADNAVDRFSWFIEDYEAQNASFRGVSDSFGFDFDLTRMCEGCSEVVGYITYVVPNSPAADSNLNRGDIFYKFNDTELTIDNYKVVNGYYSDKNITMDFATISNGKITPNGIHADLAVRKVVENPVFYSSVLTNGQTKVGYLVYNGFKYTFHEELNAIFGEFKSNGIQELVLDLRYNGGGSVLTSAYLASMINASPEAGSIFGKLTFNSKNSSSDSSYDFSNTAKIYNKDGEDSGSDATINRLSSLNRLYVITSKGTASASEMIINGLRPYMDVITIGTTTYGKNVGSHTIYDSSNFRQQGANPNHKNAMQPITFKIFNKLGESDYTQGFKPDIKVVEYITEMKPFGDLQEPLLKTALSHISGVIPRPSDVKSELLVESIFSSLDHKPFSKEMYIISNE